MSMTIVMFLESGADRFWRGLHTATCNILHLDRRTVVMLVAIACSYLSGFQTLHADDERASARDGDSSLLAELEGLRSARQRVDEFYRPTSGRRGTWVAPELPQPATPAETIVWGWLIDRDDFRPLSVALRTELRQFNSVDGLRRLADAQTLLTVAQDLGALVEQGRGGSDDDAWKEFGRERQRLASRFGAHEENFIRTLPEPLGLDVDRQRRLDRVVLWRSIRRTYASAVVMTPSDVDLIETLVATDLQEPLRVVNAELFDAELDRALGELAALRQQWARQQGRSTVEFYARVREAQERNSLAPIHSMRRDVVQAEEAIIAATIAATDALARQLDQASSHRLRTAVHSRLHPELHPIPNDLALVLIEFDSDLAAGGPWDDEETAWHARAKTLLAEGSERQDHQVRRMTAIVMNLRRAEGIESIPLPALEAETLAQLEQEREVLHSHAAFTLDQLLGLDRRIAEFPSIRRLREALADQPDSEDVDESSDGER